MLYFILRLWRRIYIKKEGYQVIFSSIIFIFNYQMGRERRCMKMYVWEIRDIFEYFFFKDNLICNECYVKIGFRKNYIFYQLVRGIIVSVEKLLCIGYCVKCFI